MRDCEDRQQITVERIIDAMTQSSEGRKLIEEANDVLLTMPFEGPERVRIPLQRWAAMNRGCL